MQAKQGKKGGKKSGRKKALLTGQGGSTACVKLENA